MIKKRFAGNLLTVLTYLEQQWGKKVADEFYCKITDALDLLKQHPYIGAPSKKIPQARGLFITRYNRLFYKVETNKIVIISLADTRRKNYQQ